MEFWGVEVKPGQTVKCDIEEGKLLHLSQAALGESKKGVERVSTFVKFNDQKLLVGTLSQEKCARIQYDLVFEKEFDLSHSSKNASVYFCGYKTASQDDSPSGEEDFSGKLVKKEQAKMKAKDENDMGGEIVMIRNMFGYKANDKGEDDDDDDDEDGVDDEAAASGKKRPTESALKTTATEKKAKLISPARQKIGIIPVKKVQGKMKANDEDRRAFDMIRNMFGYKAKHEDDDDDDDEDGVDDEAAVSGKKRPTKSASKTPATEKKAKLISPAGQKTGGSGRKGAHTASPHPAKTGKTPANNDKSKQQTPKSSGSVTCKSCSKSFNSDNALQAHTKAKHSATK